MEYLRVPVSLNRTHRRVIHHEGSLIAVVGSHSRSCTCWSTTTMTPATTATTAAATSLDQPATILLLGDSLTQLCFEGWGANLANVYQRRADVISRGCSGYTTEFYQHIPLPALSNVALVTIWFGANDASIQELNAHHHTPLDRYRENLKLLVQRVRDAYSSTSQNLRILLIAPPALDHEKRFAYQVERYGAAMATGQLERRNEVTSQYAAACVETAAALGLPVLDTYTAMQQIDDYGKFLNDGLHFSSCGHDYIATLILDAIGQHFPELAVSKDPLTGQYNNSSSRCDGLPSLGPYHDHIDHTEIATAFAKPIQPE
jgi:isoamyl acetate esterase